MSVQLIVFPQTWDGILNPIAAPQTDFIPNTSGVFPYDMISAETTMGDPVILDAFSVNPPTTNGWLTFITNFDGTPYTVTTVNNFSLPSGQCSGGTEPFNTTTGAYYAMSNLTVGSTYNFTGDIINSFGGTGTITVGIWNGNTNITSVSYTNTLATMSLSWVAQTANDVIVISYVGLNMVNPLQCDAVRFGNLSVLDSVVPPTPPTNYSSGEVILDLYEDEDLPLTLSVDEFKNVAEKVQSYSKAFNIPETKRNKRIFNQIFEITRSNDGIIFNPYKKTECILKQDGFVLFQGYLRMLDVSDKLGEVSYNINLYSETIALADTLKEKTLSDISFRELSHSYDLSNIKASWEDSAGAGINYTNSNTSGFRDSHDTLKYPFVNWTNQMPISNGSIGISGFPYLTGLGQAFRPFINVKYLIDRIFQDSIFTYSSTFFGTTDFTKLYMDFNWGESREPNINIGSGTGENVNISSNGALTAPAFTLVSQDTETYSAAPNLGYDTTTQEFTASFSGQTFTGAFHSAVRATPSSVGTNGQYMGILKAQILDSSGNEIGTAGYEEFYTTNNYASFFDYAVNFGFSATLQTGQSIRFVFQKSTDCVSLVQFASSNPNLSWTVNMVTTITTGSAITGSESLLETLRGELGQWEFLKGLITMFNLVTMPDENNPSNILIEPYSDIFINNTNSVQHNWTEKVDASEMKLTPLSDLNLKSIFKFVEDKDDFPFMNYKNLVQQHLYGSKKYNAGSEFNILDGLDEVIAEPFAATVVKPLMPQFSAFVTPAIYSYNSSDGTSKGFDNSPRIMYNNGKKDSLITYHIPAQNGGGAEDQQYFLQFSHLTDIPTIVTVPPATTDTKDFHFGECQLLVGNATANNLFNMYWLPYYNELYNPNTRTMTIKVNLNPSDINMFKFNDTVMIKNREFRVNKIDYMPNDLATVEFILIP